MYAFSTVWTLPYVASFDRLGGLFSMGSDGWSRLWGDFAKIETSKKRRITIDDDGG